MRAIPVHLPTIPVHFPKHVHRPGGRGLLTATLLAVTGCACAASTGAAAATGLGRSMELAGPTGYPQAVIASAGAPGGAQAFAWIRWSKSGSPNGPSRVQARLRHPNGRLTATQRLSAAHARAFLPTIGVDRAGAATAAWLQRISAHRFALEVATGSEGGRFGKPRVVGATFVKGLPELDESNPEGIAPQLAVAPDGAAVLAWSTPGSLRIATRRPGHCAAGARACFSTPQRLPAGRAPQIAFGAHDVAYLVWKGANRIELAVARPGRRFGEPRLLSRSDESVRDPSIGLAPDGTAVVAWRWGPLGRFPEAGIEAATRSATGALSAPVKTPGAPSASGFGVGAYGAPTVLVDPAGEALIDWVQIDYSIAESALAKDGTAGASRVIGHVLGNEPMLMDGRGDTVLAYEAGPYYEVFWSARPAGGVFGNSELLPDSCLGPPFLVPHNADTVTLGWTTRSGTRIADIRVG